MNCFYHRLVILVCNGLGCVLVCVLCIIAPRLQNYLPLFLHVTMNLVTHCAIVGG